MPNVKHLIHFYLKFLLSNLYLSILLIYLDYYLLHFICLIKLKKPISKSTCFYSFHKIGIVSINLTIFVNSSKLNYLCLVLKWVLMPLPLANIFSPLQIGQWVYPDSAPLKFGFVFVIFNKSYVYIIIINKLANKYFRLLVLIFFIYIFLNNVNF